MLLVMYAKMLQKQQCYTFLTHNYRTELLVVKTQRQVALLFTVTTFINKHIHVFEWTKLINAKENTAWEKTPVPTRNIINYRSRIHLM